ncbi:hypothetical protein KR222_006050, partial [Zaprionus bogoriensis]
IMSKEAARPDNVFDFDELCETFTKVCPDFRHTQAEKLQSLDFANKVLFELGPQMRGIKKSGTNQMWRLLFAGGDSVLIYSYTFKGPMNVRPRLQDKKLFLTLKQAGLLAANKLCSMLPLQHNPHNKVLLTPLARAVFPPPNIPKIAFALSSLLRRTVDTSEVLKAVISSCQTDGFHLPHSQCHIALVSIEVTVVDATQRNKLRSKTQRRYAKYGKSCDTAQYKIYLEHSKLTNRPPEVPMPTTTVQASIRSIDSVLRDIARTADDPISGGTLDLNFIAPPSSSTLSQNDPLPEPIDLTVEATNMMSIRSAHVQPLVAGRAPQ